MMPPERRGRRNSQTILRIWLLVGPAFKLQPRVRTAGQQSRVRVFLRFSGLHVICLRIYVCASYIGLHIYRVWLVYLPQGYWKTPNCLSDNKRPWSNISQVRPHESLRARIFVDGICNVLFFEYFSRSAPFDFDIIHTWWQINNTVLFRKEARTMWKTALAFLWPDIDRWSVCNKIEVRTWQSSSPWIPTPCSLKVHWMLTECSLNAHWMFIKQGAPSAVWQRRHLRQ
jgi:hypothetical protein